MPNFISDPAETIKYLEANSFTEGEVFLFSCTKVSETNSNSTEGNSENYKKDENTEFTAIILGENELKVKIAFLEGNAIPLISKENNELSLDLVKNHSYALVEFDSESGELIQVRYPDYVSESNMLGMIAYARGILIDKRQLKSHNNEENILKPELPHMKARYFKE